MVGEDETNCLFELVARLIGAPQWRVRRRRFGHFRVRIGEPAKAVEIETLNIKAGVAERIAPGSTVEAMGD
jgi:hypothetical protein